MTDIQWMLPPSVVGPAILQSSVFLLAGIFAAIAIRRRVILRFAVIVTSFVLAIVAPIIAVVFKSLGWVLLPSVIRVIDLENASSMEEVVRWGYVIRVGSAAFGWAVVITAFVMIARLAVSCIRGLRIKVLAYDVNDEHLLENVRRLANKLGLQKSVSVCRSKEVRCPSIWCWGLSASLILPTHENDIAESVLCHELCHLKRRDHIGTMLVELGWCLLAWNPLAWTLRRQFHETLEEACDLHALSIISSRYDYAEALLAVSPDPTTSVMLAAARSRSSLSRRIAAVLSERRIGGRLGWAKSFALFALAVSVVCGVSVTQRHDGVFYRLANMSDFRGGVGHERENGQMDEARSYPLRDGFTLLAPPIGEAVWVGKPGEEPMIRSDRSISSIRPGTMWFIPASELEYPKLE